MTMNDRRNKSCLKFVSREDEEKMYLLGEKVMELTHQEPQNEYELLRLIDEYHLDIAKLDFPEGSYEAFVNAVHAGKYDVQAWYKYYTERDYSSYGHVMTEEELVEGVARGRLSILTNPENPILKKG